MVRNCPEPKDRHDVRAFLGLSNYFRRFVKDYGQIAVGLTRLTKESVPFAWDSRAQQSFDKLREALTSPPVLAMPDFTKPFTVECDASN